MLFSDFKSFYFFSLSRSYAIPSCLIIYLVKGMGVSGTNDWDGSAEWESLDDMWIFDLNSRQWKRRWLFPLLLRSYHSLVGWKVEESLMGWGKDFANYTTWEGPGEYTTCFSVID